jgi:hypothetical protein
MLEMLKGLFEEGYQFIEESYYGSNIVEEFEEVSDAYEEAQESEWMSFDYEIDEEAKVVRFIVEDDE